MLETETVLDRRRLRRSVTFWRAAGLAAVLIAIGALTLGSDKLATLAGEKQIARVTIEGTITEDRDQLKLLKDIADDKVVLDGNHPLAGIALRFALNVADVRVATDEEIAHEHVHGSHGHHHDDPDDEEGDHYRSRPIH